MASNVRQPFRAGSFYEASASSCRYHAENLLDQAQLPDDLPAALYGGLVPHAGWMFSGKLAAMTFKALNAFKPLDTVIIFGADHTGAAAAGEIYDSGVWRTPLGDASIAEQLGEQLLAACDLLRANPQAHAHEHSIEVQIPLLQIMNPNLRILPITVAPTSDAVEIGRAVGQMLRDHAPDAWIIGSTDLTHHAGHFPAPGGRGETGVKWTVANDKRMLDLIESMQAGAIVAEAAARSNACGAGAIAATIAACQQMGAAKGICLQYTNSYEIMREMCGDDSDDTTVGYSSVVFG